MQECATSPIQTTIQFKFYVDDNSNAFTPIDIVIDSSQNQYLALESTDEELHICKINAAGDFVWSIKYPLIALSSAPDSIQLTNDESTLRFIGSAGTDVLQITQIATCKY